MYVDLIRWGAAAGEQGYEPDEVVAGWTAFAIFGLLILAVVVLGVSLTKRLKNAEAAEEAGLYDPTDREARTSLEQTPLDDLNGNDTAR